MSSIGERWSALAATQDVAANRTAHSVRQWLSAGVGLTLILLALAYVPGVRGFIGLRLGPALVLWGAVVLLQVASAWHLHRRAAHPSHDLAVYLPGAFLGQAYTCALVDLVAPEAAPVVAILFVFTAVFHAVQYRSGARAPFFPLASAVAAGLAFAFAPTLAHRSLFLVLGPMTTLVAFLAGSQSHAGQIAKREHERLKEALRSQELLAAKDEADRLGDGLKHLLGSVHDIANALGSVRAEADFLALAAESGDLAADELRETSAALLGSVTAAAKVAHEAKQVGRGELLSPIEPVALEPVVESALSAARLAHPNVTFVATAAHANVCLRVRGGAPTLRRMLENLLLNAVQGDGTKGARRVELTLERDATGLMAALHVADDGPGFRLSLLQEPIRALDTTKKDGTGVGLFTVERFAMASGGRVERRNRDEGGAQVSLVLRQEHA